MRDCLRCGRPLPRRGGTKYCDLACRLATPEAKARFRAAPPVSCVVCGGAFRTTNPLQNVCGAACRARRDVLQRRTWRRRRAGLARLSWGLRDCAVCGAAFSPRTRRSVCCGPDCSRHYRDVLRPWTKPRPRKPPQTAACAVCGVDFVKTNARQVYCSRGCYDKTRNRPQARAKYRRQLAADAAALS